MNRINKQLMAPMDKKWKRIAVAVRVFLLFSFLVFAIFACYMILFPSQTFEYFFQTPGALKNTVTDPRIDNKPVSKGLVGNSQVMTFNVNTVGNFSHILLDLDLEKKSDPIGSVKIKVQKSFRAFFYPQGSDAVFPDGTLLAFDGKYGIVSQGTLRLFPTSSILQNLGLSKQAFETVSQETWDNMTQGEPVFEKEFPKGIYVHIDEDYYQLTGGELVRFVSKNAFSSRADTKQAATQTSDMLQKFPVSENVLGFSDGSLVSSADSVFILSGGKRFPIDNTFTFTAMGYSWDDVVPVTAEELSLYEKQKLFTQDSPHPDGTVFTDRNSGKSYVIGNGERHLITDPVMQQAHLRGNTPVFADLGSFELSGQCEAKKKFSLFAKKYSCMIPIENLHGFAGNDYQFTLETSSQISLNRGSATLKKVIGKDNLISSLAEIKGHIKNTYYGPVR